MNKCICYGCNLKDTKWCLYRTEMKCEKCKEGTQKCMKIICMNRLIIKKVAGLLVVAIILTGGIGSVKGLKYNDGTHEIYEVVAKMPPSSVKIQKIVVSDVKKRFGVRFSVGLDIRVSDYALKGVNGYTVSNMRYAVICNGSGEYNKVLGTVLHEIGHLVEVDMRVYSLYMYHEFYIEGNENKKPWGEKLREEFAEDFKMYATEKYFPEIGNYFSVKKNTSRGYQRAKVWKFMESRLQTPQ